jgi:hypothetical protein
MPIDLVKRFALTPIQTTVRWSGKIIVFATNSSVLMERMADTAGESVEARAGKVDCSWRVVTEPDDDEESKFDVSIDRCVGGDGISFATIGRRSFLAYDDRTRSGISFVSERLVQDPILFADAFLHGLAALLQGGKESR